jgi:hypothetical protein
MALIASPVEHFLLWEKPYRANDVPLCLKIIRKFTYQKRNVKRILIEDFGLLFKCLNSPEISVSPSLESFLLKDDHKNVVHGSTVRKVAHSVFEVKCGPSHKCFGELISLLGYDRIASDPQKWF